MLEYAIEVIYTAMWVFVSGFRLVQNSLPDCDTQECIIQSLLSQKKDIKRHQVLIDKMKQQEEAERALAREAARQRVLTDFEKTQSVGRSGLAGSAASSSKGGGEASTAERGVKRKFEMDEDQVEKLVRESEEKALKQLEIEQVRTLS